MMKIESFYVKRVTILIGLLVTVIVPQLNGQPVYFADANLKAAVEAELGVTDPTVTDMLGLTSLDAAERGILNLTGLEYATNLTILNLYDNQISDISYLAGLTNLTHLELGYNQIIDISHLAGLTNLTLLGLGSNQISDISVLVGLTNLMELNLGYNQQIGDISALAGLTNLTYLYLENNQISIITPLAGLTNLTGLFLRSNQISDISVLANLSNLTVLDLEGNQISDISYLASMTNLTVLWLVNNQISDISVLTNLSNLTRLNLYNNQISDITPFAGLTNLTFLDMRNNPLNSEAYSIYIPQIEYNNPGIEIYYDPPPTGELILQAPNGGEIWAGGLTYPITWYSEGVITEVVIEYSLDSGAGWLAVDPTNVGNSGWYDWLVPTVISDQCLVRISDASDPGVSDTSEAVFSIRAAVVQDYIAQGRRLLFEKTLSGIRAAYLTFDDGITAFGTGNRELVFLHALTRALMLIIEEGQTNITSLFELAADYGIEVVGDSLEPWDLDTKIALNPDGYYEIPSGAPDEDEIRNRLDNFSIPEIEAILTELDLIDDTPGDRFRIFFTTEETGLKNVLEVDYGEVLILKAFLELVKSYLEERKAYDLEIDEPNRIIAEIYGESFNVNEDLLEPYPDLLKVLPTAGQPGDGAAVLAQARQDMIDGIERYFEAVDYMRQEEDEQTDDMLYIDPIAEDVLNTVEEILTDLQDSLLNDRAVMLTTETTRNYFLQDGGGQNSADLSLIFDAFDQPTGGGNLTSVDFGEWKVTGANIDDWDLYIEFMQSGDYWVEGLLTGHINKEFNTITDATFEYWGSQSGTIYDINGELLSTETVENQLDLNPLYGSTARYPYPVNPRDLLPEFDQWNGPQPGTVGKGLMDAGATPQEAARLGGIMPDMEDQEQWIRNTNMQPGGKIHLYHLSANEQILVDGQPDEWQPGQLVLADIVDDLEEPNFVTGLDIKNFYLALSEDRSVLYGAITTYDRINMDPVYYDNFYEIYLTYQPSHKTSMDNYRIILVPINLMGRMDRYEYYYGWGEWNEITSFGVSVGERTIEFSIPIDEGIYLAGRFISLNSAAWDYYYGYDRTGENNSTHLQIAGYDSTDQLHNINGNVVYAGYQDGPIVVRAYIDPYDHDDSVIASTVLHDGPGTFTLEGIGEGWSGYIEAFAPFSGANYFGWGDDDEFSSNIVEVSISTSDVQLGEDLIINPWHDSCGHAVELQLDVPFASSSVGADGEDITSLGLYDKNDVWHSFTPATDGIYLVSCIADFDDTLAVFDGCGGEELCFSYGYLYVNELYFNAQAGREYLIRLAGEWHEVGDYELTVSYYGPPLINDLCSGAIPLSAEPNIYLGTTIGATGKDITPDGMHDCYDVWHSFTPPQGGIYTIMIYADFIDSTVAIYDNCDGELLFFGTLGDNYFNYSGQETYLIRIAGEYGQTGDYEVAIYYVGEPQINDRCEDAVEVFEGTPYDGSTISATGMDISSCGEYDNRDVWHLFTAPSDGIYQIHNETDMAWGASLSVFDNCSGNELYCSDGQDVFVNAQSGESFLIRLAGNYGNAGDYTLSINMLSDSALPNDNWENAIVILEDVPVNDSTFGASGDDMTGCGYQDNLDVWYLFSPTKNGPYTINFESSYSATISVFQYGWPMWITPPAEEECVSEEWTYTLTFDARVGRDYLIRVAGENNEYIDYYLIVTSPEVGWWELTTEVVGEGTVIPSSGIYEDGTEVFLQAIPEEGWYFDRWEGDASGTDPNTSIIVDGDKNAIAVFEQGQFCLEVTRIGQGSVELEPPGDDGCYEPGQLVNLTAIPDEGWYFFEWQEDASGTDPCTSIIMDDNKSVTAVFEPYVPPDDITDLTAVPGRNTVNLTWTKSPQAEDYLLYVDDGSGFDDGIFVGDTDHFQVTGLNNSVRYLFKVVAYNQGLQSAGVLRYATPFYGLNGLLTWYSTEVGYIEGPIYHGYSSGCSDTGNNQYQDECVPVADSPVNWAWEHPFSVTWSGYIYAPVGGTYNFSAWVDGTVYIQIADTVVTDFNTPGSSYSNSVDLQEGTWTPVIMNFASNGGSNNMRLSWTPPGGSYQPVPREYLMTPEVPLTVVIEGLGEVTPGSGSYTYNSQLMLEAITLPGWFFDHWQGDAEGTYPIFPLTMNESKYVTAVFDEIPEEYFTLTVNIEGQGVVEVDPDEEYYYVEQQVTLTAIPDEGWQFVEWRGDAEGSNPIIAIIMDGDKSVTAVFELIPPVTYELVVNINGQGSVDLNPAGGVYEAGQLVNLTATAADGWRFVEWLGNAEGTDLSIELLMDGYKTVTAVFELIPQYDLVVNIDGSGSVELNPAGGTYPEGQIVNLTATPAANWEFERWLGSATGTNPTIEITMDSDKNVTVVFEQLTGYLAVTIIPSLSELDGARWYVDDNQETLYAGGEAVLLPVGNYQVGFLNVLGWVTPETVPASVIADQTTTVSGTYEQSLPIEPDTGSLRVLISSPDGEVGTQAQWRLQGQSWHPSGYLAEDLTPGPYTIEFSSVEGWITPEDKITQVTAGQTTIVNGIYTEQGQAPKLGTLLGEIKPSSIADLGFWRINGGAWHSSGDEVDQLPIGTYVVDFSPIEGDQWITPEPISVEVYQLPLGATVTGTYVSVEEVEDTLFVSPDGSDSSGANGSYEKPFRTIQKAIDVTHNPGTVIALPGTYTGPGNRDIDLKGKAITIHSLNGPETCIIDCQGSQDQPRRGFYIYHGETEATIIEGFTITGGYANTGAGILCADNSNPTIRNCIVKGNTSNYSGAGIRCNYSSPIIINCTVTSNTALMTGGGIFCYNDSYPEITNCSVTSNTAQGCGGGIYCYTDSRPVITNCLIASNTAWSCGGGIYCAENSQVKLNLCTIVNNEANVGGAIRCYQSELEGANSIIWQNTSHDSPYQIDNYNSQPRFRYCDIENSDIPGSSWNDAMGTDSGGNMDIKPYFLDPNSETANYHLSHLSPCIDAGDPNLACCEPQPNGDRVNMGAYGNTVAAAVTVDSDSDGLIDPFETCWGLDYYNVDTDEDGLTDYQEVTLLGGDTDSYDPYLADTGTGTSLNAAVADSDGDGVSDYQEVGYDEDYQTYQPYNPDTQTGTDLNALAFDTDNDQMSDGWELQYAPTLNPLDPADGLEDFDFDGYDNVTEYFSLSDPLDPASTPPPFDYEFKIVRLRYGDGEPLTYSDVKFSIVPQNNLTVSSIEFVWPDNSITTLPGRSPAIYDLSDFFDEVPLDVDDIKSKFPAGYYTINVTLSDASVKSVSFEHWYSTYPDFPEVVNPTDNQTDIDPQAVITWQGATVTHLNITDTQTAVTNLSIEPSAGAASYQIPADTLQEGSQYLLELCNGDSLAPHLASSTLIRFETTEPKVIIYVDQDATGDNDGTSWTHAYNSLSDALSNAPVGSKIRVAEGTYLPGESTNTGFILPADVTIKGGYAGSGAEEPDVRDINEYETILSGEINTEIFAYHVVTGADDAVLDGFTITAGRATDDEVPDDRGGAVYCNGTSPTISNCKLTGNSATSGGAICCENGASPSLVQCRISDNSAEFGGAFVVLDSELNLVNCLVTHNQAHIGGAGYSNSNRINVTNCTIADNQARTMGGGLYTVKSTLVLFNTILWANSAEQGSQIALENDAHLVVSYSDVQGGQSSVYRGSGCTLTWGSGAINRYPNFSAEDDYQLDQTSVCIDAGDNNLISCCETDILGNDRIYNGETVDMGCYEYQGSRSLPDVATTILTGFKATSSAKTGFGSLKVSGQLVLLDPQIIAQAQVLNVIIGPAQFNFDVGLNGVRTRGKQYIYKCHPATGGTCTLSIHSEDLTFTFTAKNVFLGGLTAPASVQINIDEYYLSQAQADTDDMNNPIPLKLLSGYGNALRVKKCKLAIDEDQESGDSLLINGEISLADNSTNLAEEEIIIHWGELAFTIPADNMYQVGTKKLYKFKKSSDSNLPISVAVFDLNKCIFKIKLNNTKIGNQGTTVDFGMEFNGFTEIVNAYP